MRAESTLPEVSSAGRRAWLRRAGTVAASLGLGLAIGESSAAVPGSPFDATLMSDVLRSFGAVLEPSTAIDIELPDLTENGAMVPISVTSRLPQTRGIMLVVEANPYPLVARFEIADGTEPFISTRVKLASSCSVRVVVEADGRFFTTVRDTTVTTGGCGG